MSHEIDQALLVDVGFVLLAEFDTCLVDVEDDELSGRGVTCLSGFLRASTEEVGMPTKPAPKQVTLYLYIFYCDNISAQRMPRVQL